MTEPTDAEATDIAFLQVTLADTLEKLDECHQALVAEREKSKNLLEICESFADRLNTTSSPRLAGDPDCIRALIAAARTAIAHAKGEA